MLQAFHSSFSCFMFMRLYVLFHKLHVSSFICFHVSCFHVSMFHVSCFHSFMSYVLCLLDCFHKLIPIYVFILHVPCFCSYASILHVSMSYVIVTYFIASISLMSNHNSLLHVMLPCLILFILSCFHASLSCFPFHASYFMFLPCLCVHVFMLP
jgi:hypothetical protein